MSSLINVTIFLVDTIFTLYMILILLRFFLYYTHDNGREPLAQLIIQATNPILRPLHPLIPTWRRIDFAALLVLFLTMLVKLSIILLILNSFSSFVVLPLLALLKTLELVLQFFSFSIIIGVIASWIVPHYDYNFVLYFLYQINELLLRPVRAHVPPVHGIDFSPFLVLIMLQVAIIILHG